MAIPEVSSQPEPLAETPEAPRKFRPFIPAEVTLPELTPLPLIVGTALGALFGASSLYLVLKVGLTVSASIPVAVISVTLFRLLHKLGLRGATILENNIVQTAGSAGEGLAFGIGVTMPAVLILGFDLDISRAVLVSLLGGLLGILMMIPLRRALIVDQHGLLKFPEGTACAEVLKAAATPEEREIAARYAGEGAVSTEAGLGAKTIFAGFGVGILYKTAMSAFRTWKEIPTRIFGEPFNAGSISAEISPELLGVGYIIGPRIASIMCGGGVLAYLVLIPAIKFFGGVAPGVIPPGTIPIRDMGPDDIRGAYVLYIGAGAVAAGGIISLARSLPTIVHGIRAGLSDFGAGRREAAAARAPRTEQDLSMKVVVFGSIALIVLIMLFRSLQMNFLGALLIVLFGFLFVTVSARLTGEIGSSSNPISGMTVATLLLTCLVFLILGWTGPIYYVTALSVGAIVCIASSNGGTIAQSLKSGFLVGATPRLQEISILVGSAASALLLGPILLGLNDMGSVYVPVADRATGQIVAQGYAPELRAPASILPALKEEKIKGPQAKDDSATYRVWHKTDEAGGPAGRYLVNEAGVPVYLVDPGINGTHRQRPDGSTVPKFDAPKATLMSYIIKGILNRQLPWGLVLLGVMIAVVLEMSGIPSLAFAVGIYLPLSSTSPILIGGLVRWAVDRHLAKRFSNRNLTEEELAAESDKSPGVLMASGYIAGGALAGIVIAFVAAGFADFQERLTKAMTELNPFFEGPYSDLLSLIPFAVLCLLLYLAGREIILASRPKTS
ncbi:MAG TPA: oligopeptide transporter, OPT family [Thermoanaerobaculia bacterium]|jgi:putative OPT family oligopeptide transporter|nr:oligopeptide transporter, OPT family [Thermoanaerobaculia bacterium]